MISFNQIEELKAIHKDGFSIVSLYLGGDDLHYFKKNYEIIVKDLIKDKEKEIEKLEMDKNQRVALEQDFEKIRQFIKNEFDWKGKRGLALFSCSAKKFWQLYPLPRAVKNMLLIDKTPYTRPLTGLLSEYSRFCVVLVDKTKARIFESFLGEIEEQTEIIDDIPRKAKAGGWKGYEENKIQRHLTEEIHRHYQNVGNALMDFLKLSQFDGLILGGHQNEFSEFESELHPYLKEKIRSRIELDLHCSKDEVLKKIDVVETEIRRDKEEKLVKKVLEMVGDRMAVSGVLGTLTALRKGQIHTLIVGKDYQVPGTKCSHCGYIDQEHRNCPACLKPLNAVSDLIEELIDATVHQGCKTEYVWDAQHMKQLGGIGALLRYKM